MKLTLFVACVLLSYRGHVVEFFQAIGKESPDEHVCVPSEAVLVPVEQNERTHKCRCCRDITKLLVIRAIAGGTYRRCGLSLCCAT